MKTMILATAAVLAMGVGSAFANEGGAVANTWFTELPGVVSQLPVQQVPSAVARSQNGSAPTATFATSSHGSGTWLFPPNANEGANN